jgi:hypothetical protein
MPRLIDDIRAAGRLQMPWWVARRYGDKWAQHARRMMEIVCGDGVPVLLIDNVADYYFRGTGQEYWDLTRDFPNLAPPYEVFWTEHKMPQTIHSDSYGDTSMSDTLGRHARMGVLWLAAEASGCKADGEIPENAKWVLCAEMFTDYDVRGKEIEGPAGTWFLLVDKEGVLIGTPHMQCYADPQFNEALTLHMTLLHPALLAVSFLHCKNVKVVDQETPGPLAKKYHARTGVWPRPFHTLEIEPLKQILRTQGGAGTTNGIAKAMHICRGHFKDYREGRGLFGKYKQLVWQPSVIRGTKGKEAAPREVRIKV